jgi:hypothetical protein
MEKDFCSTDLSDEHFETKTRIECEDCNTIWLSTDITRENSADTCTCGNIKVGIINMTPPTKIADNYFITVKYINSYPKIYEVKEKISDERILLADRNKKERSGRTGTGFISVRQ